MQIKIITEVNSSSFVRFMYKMFFTKDFRFAAFIGIFTGILMIVGGFITPDHTKSEIFLIIGPVSLVGTQLLLLYVIKKIYENRYSGVTTFDFTNDKININNLKYNSVIEWSKDIYSIKEYQHWFIIFKRNEKGKSFEQFIPKDDFNEGQLIELRSGIGKYFI
jgi:hypothetical protein